MKSKLLFLAVASIFLASCANSNVQENNTLSDSINIQYYDGQLLNTTEENKDEKEKVLVLDIRSTSDYQKGHVKFAINAPKQLFPSFLSFINNSKEKDIVLYGNTTEEAKAVANEFKDDFKDKNVFYAQGYNEFDYNKYQQFNVRCDYIKIASLTNNYVIADARSQEDFANLHLNNAINVPNADLKPEHIQQLKKATNNGQKPIITHCYRGNNANILAQKLLKAGFTKVSVAIDGTKECDLLSK